jgi:hypothetical protein
VKLNFHDFRQIHVGSFSELLHRQALLSPRKLDESAEHFAGVR